MFPPLPHYSKGGGSGRPGKRLIHPSHKILRERGSEWPEKEARDLDVGPPDSWTHRDC